MGTIVSALGMFAIVMFCLALLGFVFWVWMVIDVLVAQKEDKLVWFLVTFFLSLIGAFVYYLVARKKRKAAAMSAPPAPL